LADGTERDDADDDDDDDDDDDFIIVVVVVVDNVVGVVPFVLSAVWSVPWLVLFGAIKRWLLCHGRSRFILLLSGLRVSCFLHHGSCAGLPRFGCGHERDGEILFPCSSDWL